MIAITTRSSISVKLRLRANDESREMKDEKLFMVCFLSPVKNDYLLCMQEIINSKSFFDNGKYKEKEQQISEGDNNSTVS